MHLPFALETKQRILHTGDLLGDNSLAPKSHGRTALMERLAAKRVPVCNHAIFKKFLTWKPVRRTILVPLSQSAMGTIICFPRISRSPTVFFNPAGRFSDTIFQILWAPSYHCLSLFLPSMFGNSRRTNTRKSAEIRKLLLDQWMRQEFFRANQVQRLSILLLIL